MSSFSQALWVLLLGGLLGFELIGVTFDLTGATGANLAWRTIN